MKQLRIVFISIALFTVSSSSDAQTYVRGSIERTILEVRDAMPGVGSNGFVVPANTQLDVWANAFTSIKTKGYGAVAAVVAPYGYSFLCFFDTSSTETLYVLKESIPVQRGWGTYIFNPRGRNDLTIEIPHPKADTNTCVMGIRTFRKLEARWLFMAGTHRYANADTSADMGHTTQSVFHKGHQTIATARAIQLHGFDRTNPIYNGYPQLVISNGTTSPPSILSTLKSKYEAHGLTSGLFSSSTYSQLWRLGATQNVQGQWSNANGKAFVHVEHELPIRIDSLKIAATAEALYEAFTPTDDVEDQGVLLDEFKLDQNYPNPFNPTTNLQFSIGNVQPANLKVYDLLGREVATFASEAREPGTHSVAWHAEGIASGVYICRLTAGSFSMSKRMVLLK